MRPILSQVILCTWTAGLTQVEREERLWFYALCHNILLGNGIVGFENVGGDIDKVVGKRVTIAAFPWRWTKGDGSIVRMVAIVEE
jgi:kynurenine formamidase